jgi:hypothetical protein
MKIISRWAAMAGVLCLCAGFAPADESALNPKVQKIVSEVSEERIKAIIEKLVSFGTRNTLSSQDDPERGIGAARKWIFNELKSYSPRLQVRYDQWRVKKQGQRIFKDIDLYNVVAVLPGTKNPEAHILVTGHYDSLNLGTRPAGTSGTDGVMAPAQSNWEKNADLPAPGACDDGSGTAAVMELARVMSQYEFDKTLVFVAFAGEEQGLVGSALEAAKAKKEGEAIEAVLNNDIIGTDIAGNGRSDNAEVSVYSDDVLDSPAQALARFAKVMGERYVTFMKVDSIYMEDRLGRGGDHTPFQQEGFAAVRISTPNEMLKNQHHEGDTLENMSVPYTTRVAKVNAAVAASLALAPRAPEVLSVPRTNAAANPAAPPRKLPMITRGAGYDAVLRWLPVGSDANLKGYAIVIRSTTAPDWQQEIFVGEATEFTLKDVSVDDKRFGVKAIGKDGTESLVAPYMYPPRQKVEIQTEQ